MSGREEEFPRVPNDECVERGRTPELVVGVKLRGVEENGGGRKGDRRGED